MTSLGLGETVLILAVTLLVAAPWLVALVLAAKDISRNPSLFTYVLAAVVVLDSAPIAIVYLAYRAWRGDESREPRSAT